MKYRTIVKKDLPYLPLFKSDWLSSKKVRRCSAATRGIYADLLCVLHDEERHGCYSLHMQEERWRKSRSKTNLALAKPDGFQRLPFFADFLVSRIGSPKKVILKALKELYERKIIVVEGDSLIQPRMYIDSEYQLLPETEAWLAQSDEHEIVMEPVVEGDEEGSSDDDKKGEQKKNKKSNKKTTQNSRTRADACASRTESESENNINNSKGNIGGVGDFESPDQRGAAIKRGASTAKGEKTATKKPAAFTPPTQEEVTAYCQEKGYTFDPIQFWNHYEANGWVQGRNKPIRKWQACCVTWQQRENHGEFGGRSGGNGTRGGQQRGRQRNDTVQQHHDGGFDDMEGFG